MASRRLDDRCVDPRTLTCKMSAHPVPAKATSGSTSCGAANARSFDQFWAYTRPFLASSQTLTSDRAAELARCSNDETSTTGTSSARASPVALAKPTRKPVNAPGPAATTTPDTREKPPCSRASSRIHAATQVSDPRETRSVLSTASRPLCHATPITALAVSIATTSLTRRASG